MRLFCALCLALVFAAAPAAAGDAVFGAGVAGEPGFSQFPHWQALLDRARKLGDDKPLAPGTRTSTKLPPAGQLPPTSCDNICGHARWTAFLDSIRDKPWREQLSAVNRWANAKPYIEDWMNWGVPDYWEVPAEFVRRGGDCEDFAIAKYFSLLRLGFAPDSVRILVVEDRNLKASHAVVAVHRGGQTWLLDAQVPEIVPLDVARQYAPVYAFSDKGWWLYDPTRKNVAR